MTQLDAFSSEYPSLAQEDVLDVMRLIRSENVGPVTFFKLVSYFGSVKAALDGIPDMAKRGGRKRPIKIAHQGDAEKELEALEKFGARCIRYGEAHYPKLLHTIHDPPPLLFALGNPHIWNDYLNVGLVGARNASANGCRFAMKISQELGKERFTIISGLARGIDGAAHQGAMATGTVGVIAGGIDTLYPPEHTDLYAQMREEGAIITEQPFGSQPQARHFPARNRIISGMSHGIVVVEASLKSGSLITARMALEQNREVFSVPGSPLDPRCKGTNQLIREGAVVTESAEDIMRHLKRLTNIPFSEPDNLQYQPPASALPDENTLESARKLITEKLGPEAVLVDELIAQCQLKANVVMTVLLEMELAGRVQRHPGNRVSLSFDWNMKETA